MKVLFFILISFNGVPALATLGLQEVLESTKKHFQLVLTAKADVEAAYQNVVSNNGAFDPNLKTSFNRNWSDQYPNTYFDARLEQPTTLLGAKFFGGFRNGQGDFASYDGKYKTGTEGEVNAGVELPLLRNSWVDDRRTRLGVAENTAKGSEFQLKNQIMETLQMATYRYWDWVGAGLKLRLSERLFHLAKDRDQALNKRIKLGDAAKIESVDNQRVVAQREAQERAAFRVFQKTSNELSLYFRTSSGDPQVPSITDLPFEIPVANTSMVPKEVKDLSFLDLHPQIQRQQVTVANSLLDVSLSRNQVLPNLSAELSTAKDFGYTSGLTNSLEYRVLLKLEFPLFFRTDRARLSVSRVNLMRNEVSLGFAKDRMRVAYLDVLQSIRVIQERLDLSKKEESLALEVENAEKKRFAHGDSNLFMVNLREQMTAEAQFRVIDTLVELQKSVVDFKYSNGTL